MWVGVAEASGSGGDNLYTLLITLAVLLLGSGGFLGVRQLRRRPEVEPERVARRVVDRVEPVLQKRIRQLENEAVEADRKAHAQQVRIEKLIEALATCRAERSDLMYRLGSRTRDDRGNDERLSD